MPPPPVEIGLTDLPESRGAGYPGPWLQQHWYVGVRICWCAAGLVL